MNLNDNQNKKLQDLIVKYNHNLNELKKLNYVNENNLSWQEKNDLLNRKTIVVDNIDRLKKQIKEINPDFS